MLSDALASLLALAETGSVTAAAARRHLSQPALTRQLQRLARDVGHPVIEPRGRGVALTMAGERLVGLARRQAADLEETLAALRGTDPVPLRLGCGTTPALTLLPAALAHLHIQAPRLLFRIHAGDSAATARRLVDGEIDAGLVTTFGGDPRLVTLPILTDPVVAVGPPQSPPEMTLRDLASAPLCLYARGTGFRGFLDALFAAAGLYPEPSAEMDSLEALRELVASGLGCSLLPRSVAAGALTAGRLREIRVQGLPVAARTISLLRRGDRPPHPAFTGLHAALLRVAEGTASPAAGSPDAGAAMDQAGRRGLDG